MYNHDLKSWLYPLFEGKTRKTQFANIPIYRHRIYARACKTILF